MSHPRKLTTSLPPPNDGVPTAEAIDVTILMPCLLMHCLNERLTLPACIDTAQEAVRRRPNIGFL